MVRRAGSARDLDLEWDGQGNAIAWWRPEGVDGRQGHPGRLAPRLGRQRRRLRRAARCRLVVRRDRPAARRRASRRRDRSGSRCSSRRRARGSASPASGSRLATGPDRRRSGAARAARRATASSCSTRWRRRARAGARPLSDCCDDVALFVELHVEQGRDLVDRDVAVGVASASWAHGRWRFDFTGEPNHAGATADGGPARPDADVRDDRAGRQQAGAARPRRGRPSAGSSVEPNVTNAIPARVRGLARRARAGRRRGRARWSRRSQRQAQRARRPRRHRGRRHRRVGLARPSTSTSRCRLGSPRCSVTRRSSRPAPDTTPAILQLAGIPSAMVFVRNPTGISHSPEEFAETADCLAGVDALAKVLDGARRMTTLLVRARLARRRRRRRRGRGRASTAPTSRRRRPPAAAAAWRDPPCGLDDSRLRQLPQPRLPPRPARPDPARARAPSGPGATRCTASPNALDPDTLLRARATRPTARWPLAGITAVGEFHYLHHGADGAPYDDPNAMGDARSSPRPATPGSGSPCSTRAISSSGFGARARGRAASVQRRRRASGGLNGVGVASWPATDPDVVVGAAIHSVRAVPRDALTTVAGWRLPDGVRCTSTCPSRSPRTTPARRPTADARPSCSPTHGVLDATARRAVHATHLTDRRHRSCSAPPRAYACFCPTTERDLADGVGPSRRARRGRCAAHARLRQPRGHRPVRGDAGGRARRAAGDATQRGHWSAAELLAAGARRRASLARASRTPAGSRVGQWADLVTVDRRQPAHGRHRRQRPRRWSSRRLQPTCVHVVASGRVATRPRSRGDRRASSTTAIAAGWGEPMTHRCWSTGIGELVTNDPPLGDGVGRSACWSATRRSSSRAAGSAWVGASARRAGGRRSASTSRARP